MGLLSLPGTYGWVCVRGHICLFELVDQFPGIRSCSSLHLDTSHFSLRAWSSLSLQGDKPGHKECDVHYRPSVYQA